MFDLDQDARDFGVTAVENRFVTEYLPAAKGDYVKVYVWGLHMCAWGKPEYSLEEMAQDLIMNVSEVEAALRYWERRGLVARLSENPPAYRFYSPTQRALDPAAIAADADYVSFSEAVYSAFSDRRKVTPAEIAQAWEWVKDVGLRPEAVLMLLQHCMTERGPHFSFKAAEKLAVSMKEAGAESAEDADSFLQHSQTVHEGAKKTLSRMGKRRLVSDDELALYEKWVTEWGFEPQAILDACREMTSGDPSFKYLDAILAGIRSRGGARTGDQVARQISAEDETKKKAQEVFSRLGVRLSGPAAALEYKTLLSIQPHEVLLLAADYCRRRNQTLEDMDRLLERWKGKGYVTEDAVREYLDKRLGLERLLRDVYDACGHRGNPTAKDLEMYKKWQHEWGFHHELICCAAEQASGAEGNKITYLDKVLEAWHEAGITEISQIRDKRGTGRKQYGKTVSAQQYTQRQYTEEELLAVSDDLIEEARRLRG